jgi:polysaccharide export outer membrane protein
MMKTRSLMAVLGLLALGMMVSPAMAQNASAARTTQASAPEQNYILGTDDVVQVDALGRTDFSTKAKIGTDGTIQLPYLGTFPASNRSIAQLRDDITQALLKGGYFAKPIVQVEVISYASRYVTVLGSVVNPGLIPVDRPYRLSEIMAKVGGIKEGGADYIMVRSPSGAERTFSIKSLATGDDSADPFAQPGDKIFSPQADVFYIKGQVKAPGGYAISADMTLVMALARGGGLTDLGSDSHIKITRKGTIITPRDLNVKVEPDDVIDVGEGWF